MLLQITDAGYEAESLALERGESPVYANLVIGDGVPHANPSAATALVHSVFSTKVLVVEKLSAGARKYHASIPPDVEITLREIGLTLSDGTLYAYGAYAEPTNGFFKAEGFAFNFYTLLTRKNMPDYSFSYEPVDIAAIADSIKNQAQNSMDLYLQGYLLGIIKMLGKVSADIIELKQKVKL